MANLEYLAQGFPWMEIVRCWQRFCCGEEAYLATTPLRLPAEWAASKN
jgi:hypothetical protein